MIASEHVFYKMNQMLVLLYVPLKQASERNRQFFKWLVWRNYKYQCAKLPLGHFIQLGTQPQFAHLFPVSSPMSSVLELGEYTHCTVLNHIGHLPLHYPCGVSFSPSSPSLAWVIVLFWMHTLLSQLESAWIAWGVNFLVCVFNVCVWERGEGGRGRDISRDWKLGEKAFIDLFRNKLLPPNWLGTP